MFHHSTICNNISLKDCNPSCCTISEFLGDNGTVANALPQETTNMVNNDCKSPHSKLA